MRVPSRNLERIGTTFDPEELAADPGLIVTSTLKAQLGLETLIRTVAKGVEH